LHRRAQIPAEYEIAREALRKKFLRF
jgi:hypothetical protein